MQHARFKPRGGAHAIPCRDLTLGVVQAELELECPNPGSPRGQPGAREQENSQKTISPEIPKVQSGKTELRGTMGNPSSPT